MRSPDLHWFRNVCRKSRETKRILDVWARLRPISNPNQNITNWTMKRNAYNFFQFGTTVGCTDSFALGSLSRWDSFFKLDDSSKFCIVESYHFFSHRCCFHNQITVNNIFFPPQIAYFLFIFSKITPPPLSMHTFPPSLIRLPGINWENNYGFPILLLNFEHLAKETASPYWNEILSFKLNE